jgi:hypothetical protein
MGNGAALWPLLLPQWKDPKKGLKEFVKAEGKKDHDWAYLAVRYWPTRVDAKCQVEPCLAVAHGWFWRYHVAQAWAWELRLQDEIPYRNGIDLDGYGCRSLRRCAKCPEQRTIRQTVPRLDHF